MRIHPAFMAPLLFPLAMSGGCAGPVDLDAEREALLQADREFDRDTADRGADGWAEAFREDGRLLKPQFLSGSASEPGSSSGSAPPLPR